MYTQTTTATTANVSNQATTDANKRFMGIDEVFTQLKEAFNMPAVPTGFNRLDAALQGGLMGPSLILLGAQPGLGKTTFCTQLADHLCAAGQDVLFFSLEMNPTELLAKTLSRLSLISNLLTETVDKKSLSLSAEFIGKLGALTNGDFENKERREQHATESSKLEVAYTKLTAGHLFFHRYKQTTFGKEIQDDVSNFIEVTGRKPVVFIDYLQLIAQADSSSEKERVDSSVKQLQWLCRKHNITIFAISSINRAGYNHLTLQSGKESGDLEYNADSFWGLQNRQASHASKKGVENSSSSTREVELVILKNRKGAAGITIPFNFDGAHSFFWESPRVSNAAISSESIALLEALRKQDN